MAEHIEREAVLAICWEMSACEWNHRVSPVSWADAYNQFAEDVEEIPAADVVEVVRCGQCKYMRPEVDAYTQEVTGHWCSLLDLGSIEENHFCSYGERRDGDTDV